MSRVQRSLSVLLATAALVALPAAQGLELHHAGHQAGWVAAEPASPQVSGSEPGASAESRCPLCLARGEARNSALPPKGGGSHAAGPEGPRFAIAPDPFVPDACDLLAAGPRAPPRA